MTEIKTAQAWGILDPFGRAVSKAWPDKDAYNYANTPVIIVHGMTEAEVHEASALLEKSREVCEHERFDPHAIDPTFDYVTECNKLYSSKEPYTFCACGRKVVLK